MSPMECPFERGSRRAGVSPRGAPHARPGGDEDTVTRVWCASPNDSAGREPCRWEWRFDDDDEDPRSHGIVGHTRPGGTDRVAQFHEPWPHNPAAPRCPGPQHRDPPP